MRILTVCVGLLTVFFISACDWETSGLGINKFDYDLQGTWVSNDPGRYSGSLIISYDRITITGYNESQTPLWGDDDARPFRNFTRGTALKGYSEEGKIFIVDRGLLQEGIPYTYWDDIPPPDYRKVKFISFTFGGRVETLQSQ